MKKVIGLLVLLLVLLQCDLRATDAVVVHDTLGCVDSVAYDSVSVPAPAKAERSPKETFRKKKLITSILAFPIPFGFTGMHRIYLGSEPWVPVVYLCTGGGGAGLLPLIDFILIVTATEEEFKQYENNPNVFMFMK